jgi:acetyltransferase
MPEAATPGAPVRRWGAGGWQFELRPIAPSDAGLWTAFIRNLSPASRYKRGAVRPEELTDQLVRRKVAPDPDVEIAKVVVARREGAEEIAGVVRLVRHDEDDCEFLLVVGDRWQRRGIGGRLMSALDEEGPRFGARRLYGLVLATNRGMLEFCERLGFAIEAAEEGPLFRRVTKAIGGR